jgi:spore maturation protein CgeB
MPQPIKTLLLEANGTHWTAVAAETLVRGVLGIRAELPERYARIDWLRKAIGRRYEMASYLDDWKDAFCGSPHLDVEACNVTDLTAFARARAALVEYPLVVVLHSVAGDRMGLLLRTVRWFQRRRGKLAVFIGNEYDLMEEKIRFLRETGADYICSQLPIETARWLYQECRDATVLPMAHALNPDVYKPVTRPPRPIDIGFIGDLYERLIGDTERTDIVRFFERHGGGYGLRCEIRSQRMRRSEWAEFLNRCNGVIGAESGTYYLDRDGRIVRGARAFLARHPQASFDEVYDACFRGASAHVSGKAISSRHFEPIGTMTCQVLVEGHYNGILEAGRHYIPVKRDLSDIDEAIRQFKDVDHRSRIAGEAYEHVLSAHTHAHRVERLLAAIDGGHRSAPAPPDRAPALV